MGKLLSLIYQFYRPACTEIKDLVDAEQKVLDYELYLKLVSSDGIPRLIINDALPVIEAEVNTVLDHMMAGFHLGITNEDKNINLYIRYNDEEWPLSLSSGMEKFVSSLALRVGLINVSNLPSPNFLVIDEGFGTLDTDNLSNMKGAFEAVQGLSSGIGPSAELFEYRGLN